jgi:predicted AAA+ superfamily ATPase
MVLDRLLSLKPNRSHLLLGPRRVGKSTFLRQNFPDAEWIDLLKTDLYYEYSARPALLRERYSKHSGLIVIDEVQRIPDLMHEIHWLLENSKCRFILSGSSARTLRRQGLTNLAGRLSSARMYPLTYAEIPDFDLVERLQWGCLPPIVFSDAPTEDLKNYCGEYLREEIQSEGIVRNIPAFTRFLEMAALSNAELVSYASLARDCGIAPKTAREYFQILEDTLLGYTLDPWTKSKKRRAIMTSKFYYFDCGIPNSLLGRKISPKTPEFGKSFEQWLVLEAIAAKSYFKKIENLRFWRSASQFEVDLIIDDHTAVEFRSGPISAHDARGLNALAEEMRLKSKWIVGMEPKIRHLEGGIEVLPWKEYLRRLPGVA